MDEDAINLSKLEDKALSAQATSLQAKGRLAADAWTDNYRPAGGWNLDSFRKFRQSANQSTPPFPGSENTMTANGGWLDQARTLIGGSEGFESKLYRDPLDPERKSAGKYISGDGYREGDAKQNATIGFGWNISANPDSAAVFERELGIDKDDFARVKRGELALTRQQGEKLRDYAIIQRNATLDRMLTRPVKDHQRAALLSLQYNFSPAGFKNLGVIQAINEGKADSEVAALIARGGANPKPALAERRRYEAQVFLGAKRLLTPTAPEVKPQDRH
jgi:GH24 family phage-related lysozyme (muramidase)